MRKRKRAKLTPRGLSSLLPPGTLLVTTKGPVALARLRQADKGGRHPHPDRTPILKHYRECKARGQRNAAKATAQWVDKEVEAGRMTETVHPDTIRIWDREEKTRM